MEFHLGTHRYVFIVGPLVIKVARIRWWLAAKDILSGTYSMNPTDLKGVWKLFSSGLMENIREGICYITTRHELLVPVLPLVFVNLQLRVRGVRKADTIAERDDILYKIIPLVKKDDGRNGDKYGGVQGIFQRCVHTFERDNFSFDGGHIRFVDYGEDGVRDLILKYGDRLEEHFLSISRALIQ